MKGVRRGGRARLKALDSKSYSLTFGKIRQDGGLAIAHRFCSTFSILHIPHILHVHIQRTLFFVKNVNEVLTRVGGAYARSPSPGHITYGLTLRIFFASYEAPSKKFFKVPGAGSPTKGEPGGRQKSPFLLPSPALVASLATYLCRARVR